MEVGLENGTVLGIDGSRQGYLLRCLEGCLWLTKTGDSRDYFLMAGQQMTVLRNEQVVVEGWGETRILFLNPAKAGGEVASPCTWHLVGA